MKIRNFSHDYTEQLKRPKPKKFRGRNSVNYSFEKRYNNSFSIEQRIARYQNSLSEKLLNEYKYFKKFFINTLLKNLFGMKNETLNNLMRPTPESVTANLTATFGALDYSVINWSNVDFSTQDKFRPSFVASIPTELLAQLDDIEAQKDSTKRSQKRALNAKLQKALENPEIAKQLLALLNT